MPERKAFEFGSYINIFKSHLVLIVLLTTKLIYIHFIVEEESAGRAVWMYSL